MSLALFFNSLPLALGLVKVVEMSERHRIFKGMSPLCPPLPGKVINLFFSTLPLPQKRGIRGGAWGKLRQSRIWGVPISWQGWKDQSHTLLTPWRKSEQRKAQEEPPGGMSSGPGAMWHRRVNTGRKGTCSPGGGRLCEGQHRRGLTVFACGLFPALCALHLVEPQLHMEISIFISVFSYSGQVHFPHPSTQRGCPAWG